MSYDPLTDPTSLIAYRLANRESMTHAKRRATAVPSLAALAFAAAIVVVLVVVVMIAWI